MTTLRMWMRVLSALLAITLVAAACSSDDDGDDGGDSASTTTAATGDTSEAGDTGDSDDDTGESGDDEQAGPADDSLDPVVIGVLNQEGVPGLDFPEARESVEAIAQHINDNRGGIDGHPVQIESCVNNSPESTQACAQELAAIEDIDSIYLGINVFTSGFDLYGTFGDIPVVGGNPLFPGDWEAPSARYFYGGSLTVFGSMATFVVENLETESVALIAQDNPAAAAALEPVELVLTATETPYEVITVPNDAADMTGPMTQASDGFDHIMVLTSKDLCVPIIQSVDLLGIPKESMVYTGTCNVEDVMDEVVDLAVGSYMHTTAYIERANDAPADKQAETAERAAAFAEYAPDINEGAFASVGAQALFNIERLYEEIGVDNLSPETILATLDDGQPRANWGAIDYACPIHPDYSSLCGAENFVAQIEEDGSMTLGEPVSGIDIIAELG